MEQIKARSTAGAAAELAANARQIGGVRVVAARLEGVDGKALREAVDQLKDRLGDAVIVLRSEEHTSELQSLMRISYAVFCLKKKKTIKQSTSITSALQNKEVN